MYQALKELDSELLMNLINGFVIILLLLVVSIIYLNIRTNKVLHFMDDVLIDDQDSYMKLPDAKYMIFSFKPLKLENWIEKDKEEERIKSQIMDYVYNNEFPFNKVEEDE